MQGGQEASGCGRVVVEGGVIQVRGDGSDLVCWVRCVLQGEEGGVRCGGWGEVGWVR